jgi:hypothetical protein
MVNKITAPVATEPNIELKQLTKLNTDNDDTAAAVITGEDVMSILSTIATTPSPTISETDNKKKSFIDKIPFKKSWLLWWNSEEWWSCWIGLIFFGCIASAVKDNIPSPQFLPWEKNPFSTFAAVGNYGLIVICVCMGALLWLAMAATKAPNWRKFPLGYAFVFTVALISKMLASNGKREKSIMSHCY